MNKKLSNINLRLTSSEEVHIRSSVPELKDNNKKGVVYSGNSVEFIEEWQGELHKGINKWYRDRNGDFYWSGGFKEFDGLDRSENTIEGYTEGALDWWHSNYDIKNIWDSYGVMGEGITIALIDSGLKKDHFGFNWSKISGKNYHANTQDFDDAYGHGTSTASLMCAHSNKLIGIAPRANLHIAKFFHDQTGSIKKLIYTLNNLPQEVDIIVIPQRFKKSLIPGSINNLKSAISLHDDKIIVAAIGNDGNHAGTPLQNVPAALSRVISITAIDQHDEIYYRSTKSNKIDYAAPGVNVKSLNIVNEDVIPDSGTSFAAPFVGGVFALMLSYIKKEEVDIENRNDKIKKIVIDTLRKKGINDSTLFGSGIINPQQAFIELTKLIRNG